MEALDNPSYFSMTDGSEVKAVLTTKRTETQSDLWRVRRSSESASIVGQDGAYCSRRHSLGTFPRSSRTKHVLADKDGKMLDITLISSCESEDATLWANYLTSCFQEISNEENKPPFKLARVMMENVLLGRPMEGSRLQIVIVCPKFLRVLSTSQGLPLLATALQPATILAMLLGVTHQALENHQYAGLFRFDEWRKMTVKDKDKTFVGDFLGVAMDVLSRSWQLQQAIQQVKTDSNRSHFSIIPKKIKVGQNKLLILLNDPLCNSDKITITIDKGGQKLEVASVKRRNPYTLQFSMPTVCLQSSQLVGVAIERNGRSIGHRLVKCECRLRELDQLLRSTDNPLAFMCQALGINGGDRDHLDTFLVSALQKNIPPNFNLLSSPMATSCTSKEEYPTLLHFAARFGLEKLCWQLLECPGGDSAMQMKNCSQQSPSDLAERHGHTSLAHSLNSYQQMTELSSMYTYINSYLNSSNEKLQDFGEGNYLLPRPLSDTYLVPPKARPVTPTLEATPLGYRFQQSCASSPVTMAPNLPPPSPRGKVASLSLDLLENYQSPPHARPFTPLTPSTPNTPTDHFSSYLHMHSPMSDISSTNFDNMISREKKYFSLPGSDSISIASSGQKTRSGRSTCASSVSSSKTSPDDELAEIITDFKNNVYSIGELEKLVDAWKNRNDVQQSFREKKEQINLMRQEYERIQLEMKEQLKRPTPFDRIKKFFSRKSKHEGCHHKEKTVTAEGGTSCQRPVSSLSLHSSCSSSSSGRMSTTSGVSLGDSGTHSDPDEKKSEITVDRVITTPSAAFYERMQRQDSSPDEYVPATTYKLNLPQPPTPLRRTFVEVHRSDVLEEMQEENSDQTLTTSNETSEKFESQQNSDNSDATYINTSCIPKDGESIAFADSECEEKNEVEMKILEQSEKLLKDMVDGLPNKDTDILSPPESAFIDDSTKANEDNSESLSEDIESETSLNIESSDCDCQVEKTTQLTDGLKNPATDEPLSKYDYVNQVELGNIEFSQKLTNSINEKNENESVVLKDQYQAELESIFTNNLPEYVNVTNCKAPPIPPRFKYKNVLL